MIAQVVSPVMVGRDAELATLEEALLAARRGDSRVVVLSGEAGVGKSRLVAELRRRADAVGCTVLVGECSEADLALPYLPFVEAIGNLLASGAVDMERVRGALGSEMAPLTRLLPQLGAPEVSFNPTATPLDKLRLFEAVVTLLQALSSETGLLLVVEDIHWADQSTQELLDYLTRRLPGTRTLTLVTHRIQELGRRHPLLSTVQRWRRAGISDTITLPPLGVDDVSAMVAAIFDLENAPPDFARSLHERSEGIPFAVEELLRDAVDHGRIGGKESRWDSAAVSTMPPPRTLADNILLRVERLVPEHVEVVRIASVVGRSVDFALLVQLAELPEVTVMSALDASVGEQLLEEDTQHENSYRFRHALIRDAIYNDILAPRRRSIHGRAADALNASHGVTPADLASHLIAAGRYDEAGPACARAADDALTRLAPREACDLFERALAHIADPREQGRLRCRLGEAWRLAGDVAVAERHLEEGVAALEESGDAVTAAHYRLSLGRCHWERSNGAAERDQYQRAIDVLEGVGVSEDLANAYMRLSSFHSRALEGAEAQRLAERAIEIADATGVEEARIAARNWLGLSLCAQGMLDDGLAELERCARDAHGHGLPIVEARIIGQALDIMQTYGRVAESTALFDRLSSLPQDPWRQVVTAYDKGWVQFWNGDLGAAAISARSCVVLAERFGMDAQLGWGRGLLCAVQTEMGQLEAARELLPVLSPDMERQALVEQSWVSLRFHLAFGEVATAAALAAGLIDLAWAVAGTALSDTAVEALIAGGDIAAASRMVDALEGEPRSVMHTGHVLRARGRVRHASGDGAGAIESLRAANQAFATGGYRLEQLRTTIVAADAQARSGEREAARTALEETVAAARAMGAETLAQTAARVATENALTIVTAEPALAVPTAEHGSAAALAEDPIVRTGERLVSVLFADVRGFTAMTHQHAPAEMADRIAAFQRLALLAVERHHGIVDKFAGDAVMATFNASGWHVDHSQHALEVAISLVATTSMVGLPVGAGVAVGPAIVGQLAGGANVAVLGPTTNLASRLQAQAEAGQIMLSADAYARLQHTLPASISRVEECDLRLKGFDGLVRAYRLSVTRS